MLFIGDGSAQLTIQELATVVRQGLNPVIFLINNDGYTIERAIHGKRLAYNDIAPMVWQKVPAAFGATDENTVVLRASTVNELLDACATAQKEKDKMVSLRSSPIRTICLRLCASSARWWRLTSWWKKSKQI